MSALDYKLKLLKYNTITQGYRTISLCKRKIGAMSSTGNLLLRSYKNYAVQSRQMLMFSFVAFHTFGAPALRIILCIICLNRAALSN